MTAESFIATVAIVGVVIVVSTLLSGWIDRTGLPHPAVFLLLGLVLGPMGVQLLRIGLDSPILRVVSILGLVLVLFTDALGLNLGEVRRHVGLAFRVLVPGTLISAAAIGVAAWAFLGLHPAAAAILGAALASTDPVLLRGLLRRPDVPESARVALRLESGLNDVVLLPIVLGGMALLAAETARPGWGRLAVNVLVLGPLAGVVVGFAGVSVLEIMRRKAGIRRDYESLYSLGIAFSAFAAAEALHGSGYLAAFAAGLTIVALDVELCDCFLEYGETTAEMALLFTFVLFGTSLLWTGFEELTWRTGIFAAGAVLVRPVIYTVSLLGSSLTGRPRLLVAWFGPRGLSSLLLVLLPVFAGIPEGVQLFRICSLVVMASVVAHGLTIVLLVRRRGPAPPPAHGGAAAPTGPVAPERLTIDDVKTMQAGEEKLVIGDVRAERNLRDDDLQATGALRLDPSHPVEDAVALNVPRDATIALYCA